MLHNDYLVRWPAQCVGWIQGIGIGITFYVRDFIFLKTATYSVNHADSEDIRILVQFPGNSILKFWVKFWNCVGVSFPKSTNEYIFLHWSFWYIKLNVLIWFNILICLDFRKIPWIEPNNVSVMTLIPRLEEEMFKHHMKKYQAALNGLRRGSDNGRWWLLSWFWMDF